MAQGAIRGLEGVKKSDRLLVEWRGSANPGGGVSESAHAAMRGLTRHFRVAFARKCSVCPRIARQEQSGRLCFVQSTSPQCEDKSKNSARRGRLCDFFTSPDEIFPRRSCAQIFRLSPHCSAC